MRRWRLGIFAATMYICFAKSQAQQDIRKILTSLADQAKAYQRAIPNFTCNEVVTTTAKRDGKLLKRIEFQADIQVQRKQDQSLSETFLITKYMGKPRPAGSLQILLYVEGGFGRGLPSFIEADSQACYDYSVSDDRVEFRASKSGAENCKARGLTGFVEVDSSGKLLRGEMRTSLEESVRRREPLLAQIEYVDVRLDDRLFRMPSHLYAEIFEHGLLRTFDAYYTGCKLFTAKTTIRPGDGMIEPVSP